MKWRTRFVAKSGMQRASNIWVEILMTNGKSLCGCHVSRLDCEIVHTVDLIGIQIIMCANRARPSNTSRQTSSMERLFRRAMSSSRAAIEDILKDAKFPPQWPFSEQDFSRLDESSDDCFYAQPRIGIFHIDHQAVCALTRYYAKTLPKQAHILDLCSSWVSHLPEDYQPGSLTVLGMSQEELAANTRATRRIVQDLNRQPVLPFEDNSFDIITNVVSVDYLTQPVEVFREMGRVLKPGGRAIMSFSNRCFPTKAIDVWCRTSDAEHVFIVGCYFHYSGAFDGARGSDLKAGWFGMSDPLYVVEAQAL